MSLITIEVAYALPKESFLQEFLVQEGTTALQAFELSQVARLYPEIHQNPIKLGIFGDPLKQPSTYILEPGDRVEVYRPLKIDPKTSRRQRVLAKNRV